jgi:hypothetical protein
VSRRTAPNPSQQHPAEAGLLARPDVRANRDGAYAKAPSPIRRGAEALAAKYHASSGVLGPDIQDAQTVLEQITTDELAAVLREHRATSKATFEGRFHYDIQLCSCGLNLTDTGLTIEQHQAHALRFHFSTPTTCRFGRKHLPAVV